MNGARGHARGVLAAGVALALVVVAAVALRPFAAARARVEATTRVAEVGVDQHGYWFVRVEVVNTGTLPWRCVWVSNPGLVGNSPPLLELGSTLPTGEIPERFEFVLETIDEGAVPQDVGAVTFDLAVLAESSWFQPDPKPSAWPRVLSL